MHQQAFQVRQENGGDDGAEDPVLNAEVGIDPRTQFGEPGLQPGFQINPGDK